MVTFCALVYYKRLQEKLPDLNSYDIISLYNYSRVHPDSISVIEKSEEDKDKLASKKQRILNKWRLYVTLVNNNTLIIYRKKEFSHNRLMGLSAVKNFNEK